MKLFKLLLFELGYWWKCKRTKKAKLKLHKRLITCTDEEEIQNIKEKIKLLDILHVDDLEKLFGKF